MSNSNIMVFVDPSSAAYYSGRLFDVENTALNRDGCLLPFYKLKTHLSGLGQETFTADYLFAAPADGRLKHYYSLGVLSNFKKMAGRKDVQLKAFIVFEPPVVAPYLYAYLPELCRNFEKVYVHNTEGDGYSLRGVDQSKLRKLWWPQPYDDVRMEHWNNLERSNRIVVVNGNHIPRRLSRQLYGKRIEAMAALASLGAVDLYGMGWRKWWSHRSMWPPYWFNYRTLMSIYQGPAASKYQTLSRYRFSLCFENMSMKGYLTEKLFDCLYAGTVPIYLGAPDIADLVPEAAYIDARKYRRWSEMWEDVKDMPEQKWQDMREAGRAFLRSEQGMRYYNSLIEIFSLGEL